MVQQKSRQESLADEEKRESNKKKKLLKELKIKELKIKKLDDMSMPPDRRSKEQKIKDFKDSLLGSNLKLTPEMLKNVAEGMKPLKDGGEVKKYKKGGSVHKNKKNMITTKGWGASRKT
jgi:hypothetical protein